MKSTITFQAITLFAIIMAIPGSELHSQCTLTGKVSGLKPAGAGVKPVQRYPGEKVLAGLPEKPAAVVYLEGDLPNMESTNRVLRVEMTQRDLQFHPGLLPIQVGTTVEFPNLDDTYHNVFSYSKPKRFDLGRYRKDEKPASQTFDKPGVVKLFCEIHEHMRGTILVLETPYFQKTDPEGHFRLENLPAGKFKARAFIDEKTILEKEVELVDGKVTEINF